MFTIINSALTHINPGIPGLIYSTTIDGTLLSCNQQFSTLAGLNNHQDIKNKSASQLFNQQTLISINANHKIILNQKSPQQFEEIWQLTNNKIITCTCIRAPIYDKNQRCIAIIASAINFVAHKAEKQLLQEQIKTLEVHNRTTELYLKNIIDNLADHVFWKDKNGTFLGCNDQQAISIGLKKADDVIGKAVTEIGQMLNWEPAMVEQLRKNDLEVMQLEKTISVEEEIIWADGVSRTYLSKKAPLKDDNGNCVGIIGLAFDITERKIMEKNLRIAKARSESANIAKSNFIANISHDLRTPLHTMLGIAELLQIKKHYPEQESLIEGIIQSGQNLLKLVEQVLQFSEIETTQQNLSVENLDLRQLIENLIMEHAAKAKDKNLDLIISYCESTPRLIKSNAQYLRRIIGNLLGNALKFTNYGHILVSVEQVEIHKSNATLQIVVEDTGVGISTEDLKYIFDRFYRAAPSYAGQYKGSGLGLAIAKQLTERLGGELQVNSQLGVGTTFSCTLNFQLESQNIDYQALENQFLDANILIIDDHVKRRETLLKQIPCIKKIALSSTKAFELFVTKKENFNYNLIIIDDEIKTINSDYLAKIINESSDSKTQPLLVLVTKLKNHQIINTPENLFKQALSKPLQPTDINHRLAPAWKKWQSSQQRKHHQPIKNSLSILLVEDEPLIQLFTQEILSEFGCRVTLAKDGNEAIDKSQQLFDLIFMDIGLPDISGVDITKKIREANNPNNKTPIIALTAHVSDHDKECCISAGINDFLTKPASYLNFRDLLIKYQSSEKYAVDEIVTY